MTLYNRAIRKLHIKLSNWILRFEPIAFPNEIKNIKNIFLYFDYEREFGGHHTNITDQNIEEILNFLAKYNIETTWFTVGKIFEKYPDSIKLISEKGHELGSHTYNHIIITKLTQKQRIADFNAFRGISRNHNLIGFHPPQGRWDMKTIRLLSDYNFKYELSGFTENNNVNPVNIVNYQPITRFTTLGDDWQLYVNKMTENEAFNYFNQLFNRCREGHIAGIGFHPWILFHNMNYWNAFKRFIIYLKALENVQIRSVSDYFKTLKMDS